MKKIILILVLVILAINSIPAQEVQLSLGLEYGIGRFKVDNDIAWNVGLNGYFFHTELDYVFFAPGLSFAMRVFNDTESPYSIGYFLRSRAIFATHINETGTISDPFSSESVSEKYTFKDDVFFGLLEFGLGPSTRWIISERLQLATDFGINFTIMDMEDYDEKDTLNYWGIGLYAATALQLNLKNTMYLEFGINSLINVISSQKGTFFYTPSQKIKYEDTGRWDLFSIGAFIHIGWRIDMAAQRAAYIQRYLAAQQSGQSEFELVRTDGGTAIRITRYAGNDTIVRIPMQLQYLPVTSIGDWAFAECNLTSVIIPNGVVSIGEGAFYKNSLNSITIPGSITSIREHAFHLNELSRIMIGANVSIAGNAFDNDFASFYNENGRRAGTYTFSDGSWSADFEFWI